MPKEKLETDSSESLVQSKGTSQPITKLTGQENGVPVTGQREALEGLKRKLTPKEMAQPGAAKLILEILLAADNENKRLKPFEEKYYDADKNAAVLLEKLNSFKSIEVFFVVGVGLGGVIIGLVPFFNSLKPIYGILTGIFGLALVGCSVVARMVKK